MGWGYGLKRWYCERKHKNRRKKSKVELWFNEVLDEKKNTVLPKFVKNRFGMSWSWGFKFGNSCETLKQCCIKSAACVVSFGKNGFV